MLIVRHMKSEQIFLSCLILLFIAALVFVGYYWPKVEKRNKEEHIALVNQAETLLMNLDLGDLRHPIYERMESNVRCNEAYYTAVFLTNNDLHQKCKDISGKISDKGWEIYRNCAEIKGEKYNQLVLESLLRQSSSNEIDHFEAGFFPKNATHPLFIPRSEYWEHDLLLKIREYGQSFYYLSYNYSGPSTYYREHHRCDESGRECNCAYSTYSYTIFAGEEHEWVRTKLEQFLFD